MQTIKKIIASAPDNLEIVNSWLVTDNKLSRCRKALCSVSGGSDSDIVTHLCATLDHDGKVVYVFFDYSSVVGHLDNSQLHYHKHHSHEHIGTLFCLGVFL